MKYSIVAKWLYYTRSLNIDYRWAYIDEKISEADEALFMRSYCQFEKDKNLYLNARHIFVQRLTEGGFAFYKFCRNSETDRNGRIIYSLSGLTFLDYKNQIHDLLSIATTFFFENLSKFIPSQIGDNELNIAHSVEIDISNWADYFNKLLREHIDNFLISDENAINAGFVLHETDGKLTFQALPPLIDSNQYKPVERVEIPKKKKWFR